MMKAKLIRYRYGVIKYDFPTKEKCIRIIDMSAERTIAKRSGMVGYRHSEAKD